FFINQRTLLDLLSEAALLLQQGDDLAGIGLHIILQHVEIEADSGQFRFSELVDQIELVMRGFRNVLDLVLAIDVRRNQPGAFERDRLLVRIQDDGFAIEGARDRVSHSIFRLDLQFDATTLQIRPYDAVESAAQWIAVAPGHGIKAEADEFDDGALAGAARTDEAVQAVAKFDVGSVKEAAEDAESPDAVKGGVLHVCGAS